MKLKLTLQDFRDRLLKASHILSLQKTSSFVIVIKTEAEFYFLEISEKDVVISQSNEIERFDVTISGKVESLLKLIMGQLPLRKLQKNEEIKVEGRYSALLKTETIFYLNQFE